MALPDPNSFQSVGWLLLAAGGASMTLNQLFAFVRNVGGKNGVREIQPNPVNVRLAETFATKTEVEGLREDMEGRFSKMEVAVHELRTDTLSAGERRASQLHGRINEVLAAVSELRGEIKRIH